MDKGKKIIVTVVIFVLGIIGIVNAGMMFHKAQVTKDQNALLEQRVVELKAQNELLRENKMCLAKERAAELADPVCGPNPDALKPTPAPHH